MARQFAADIQFKAVITWTWKDCGEESMNDTQYKSEQGPYSKVGIAESQLTRMWKHANKFPEHKDNITGWVERGEVTWTKLPNRDDKDKVKLNSLEEELWNG